MSAASFGPAQDPGSARASASGPNDPPVVTVELVAPPAREALEHEWRALEARSDGSFFISWTWIGAWLAALDGAVELVLLRASIEGRCVGLGLLAPQRTRRRGIISSQTLHLHATGRAEFDSLTIECNGFLVEQQHAALITARMYEHLGGPDVSWDELVLDGLVEMPRLPLGAGKLGCRVRVEMNHHVDLALVRARQGDYIGLLGSKTRARIRQAQREYAKIGPLRIEAARTEDEAQAFLDGLKWLHQSHWIGRGEPGAFANRFFEQFHRRLIREAFSRGEVQLLAVHVGARALGYIYSFVQRGHVYFYQCGFNYDLSERYNQPGLVCLAAAIEFYAAHGMRVFDLLAGDTQYKRRLGTHAATLFWATLQRERLTFRLENAAREVRAGLRNWVTVPGSEEFTDGEMSRSASGPARAASPRRQAAA